MNILVAFLFLGLLVVSHSPIQAASPSGSADAGVHPSRRVVLFVLEGLDRHAVQSSPMPVLSGLVKRGSVAWSAETTSASGRLPAMASLVTGLPVSKHGITWEHFEFSRGYPRPPTVFDYLDLSGGRDSAIFFMDEAFYQLAKPAPYTDYQLCGLLKPECNPQRLVAYINQYIAKSLSGQGFGHATEGLPDVLLVHLPQGGRAGEAHGWASRQYQRELGVVDQAIGAVLDVYRAHGLLSETTVFVTSLSSPGPSRETGVPWIASGFGVKPGYLIKRPVSIVDTGATIMRTLGLATHTEWESRPIDEIFLDGSSVRLAMRKER